MTLDDVLKLAKRPRKVVPVYTDGGAIFVGDVRCLPLLGAFHGSVELHRSPSHLPASTLRGRVERAIDKAVDHVPMLLRGVVKKFLLG